MPENAMILIPHIGKMTLGQAEKEIRHIERQLEDKDLHASTRRNLEDNLKSFREGVSKFYRVTSKNRHWI